MTRSVSWKDNKNSNGSGNGSGTSSQLGSAGSSNKGILRSGVSSAPTCKIPELKSSWIELPNEFYSFLSNGVKGVCDFIDDNPNNFNLFSEVGNLISSFRNNSQENNGDSKPNQNQGEKAVTQSLKPAVVFEISSPPGALPSPKSSVTKSSANKIDDIVEKVNKNLSTLKLNLTPELNKNLKFTKKDLKEIFEEVIPEIKQGFNGAVAVFSLRQRVHNMQNQDLYSKQAINYIIESNQQQDDQESLIAFLVNKKITSVLPDNQQMTDYRYKFDKNNLGVCRFSDKSHRLLQRLELAELQASQSNNLPDEQQKLRIASLQLQRHLRNRIEPMTSPEEIKEIRENAHNQLNNSGKIITKLKSNYDNFINLTTPSTSPSKASATSFPPFSKGYPRSSLSSNNPSRR